LTNDPPALSPIVPALLRLDPAREHVRATIQRFCTERPCGNTELQAELVRHRQVGQTAACDTRLRQFAVRGLLQSSRCTEWLANRTWSSYMEDSFEETWPWLHDLRSGQGLQPDSWLMHADRLTNEQATER
jgi:hypothetical protein